MPVFYEHGDLQIWNRLQVPSPKRKDCRISYTPTWASLKTCKFYFYFLDYSDVHVGLCTVQLSSYKQLRELFRWFFYQYSFLIYLPICRGNHHVHTTSCMESASMDQLADSITRLWNILLAIILV